MSTEQHLRSALGIPADARRVLVFTESSHWDPDWLFTSEEYFERMVRRNLDIAIRELQKEPRRIYSVECMFFLRMYWDRCPEKREAIRKLVNEGRLRLTSSGVTTADTIIPGAEAILRDLHIGQEWMRANGLEQEPRLAYFTDSFGCTPNLPSLLRAAGFDRTAITRLDGMYFAGCELDLPSRFPRPGSSAELLLNRERTLDFVWRDSNGAQVLCHWNAFTYGQGDMLAHGGFSRLYLIYMAFERRSDRHVARRIAHYVKQLAPYSRTPYMLCPIGFDFVDPIPDLVTLLDRYNRNHYPTTGVWVVNAGLDDYLALVEQHRDKLPVLELDPNPYWTGFYTARPTLKQRCRHLADRLLLAEKLAFVPENRGTVDIADELREPWWAAAVSNHHDFVTGTSPDRVVEEEQIPWLDRAMAKVDQVIHRLTPPSTPNGGATRESPPTWHRDAGRIKIETGFYDLEMDEDAGGTIAALYDRETGSLLLTGTSNDLVSYRDSGGLWRMGYEFNGGVWRESARASERAARIDLCERDGGVEVVSTVTLDGETFRRYLWLSHDSPLIYFRVEGRAAEKRSVVARFATGIAAGALTMDTPGGVVTRPLTRIYNPTFWPLHSFVHLQDKATGRGLAVIQPLPGAVSCRPDGQLELVTMRNATREKAFGLIGIPGNPASGHEREPYACEYALLFTRQGDWRANGVHRLARTAVRSPWSDAAEGALWDLANAVVVTDSPDVWAVAVKSASRGEGVIVRLYACATPESPVKINATHFEVVGARLCDARERDLESLPVRDGVVTLTMPGTIATVRLLLRSEDRP